MKRTFPHNAKPVEVGEADSELTSQQSKQAASGTGRTRSAAMIGLAISVGASSILLPKGGDGAIAAEPPTPAETAVKIQPAPLNAQANPLNVESEVAEPTAVSSNSVVVRVQQGQTLWELSQDYQVDPKTLATANGIRPDSVLQVGQPLRIPADKSLLSDAKTGNTIATLPDRTRYVEPDQRFNLITGRLESSEASDAQHSREAKAPQIAIAPVNDPLQPGEITAINQFKNSENRFTKSWAELGSEESANLSESSQEATSSSTERGQSVGRTSEADRWARGTSPTLPSQGVDASKVGPLVLPSPSGEALLPSAIPSASQTQSSALNETPTEASEVLYQVQVGDTLNAIASRHGISVSELISANHLSDPHFLTVNQYLKIPKHGSNQMANPANVAASGANATGSLPLNLNPSALENAGSSAAEPTSALPMIASLTSPQGTSSVSVPTAVTMNSIPLTPSVSTTNETEKTALRASESSAIAKEASVTMPSTAGGMMQPATFDSASAAQLPSLNRSTSDLKAADPAALPATPANPYADRLRAEISRLRAEYRADRKLNKAAAESTLAANPQPEGLGTRRADSERPVNPEYSPRLASQSVQNEVSQPQAQQWAQHLQKQGQERADATSPQSSQQSLVAAASLGNNAYDPLSNPSLGRMVSPELPPLPGADTYLPGGTMRSKGFIWPAQGVLTSGYGWRWGRMHKGIDIAGPVGTPIVAVDDGVVTYAGWNDGGYGYLVEITHANGNQTIYAHNSRILVQEGQQVAQGQQISEMGSTGFSTGPHLHFEIHPAGQGAVNPMAFLPQDSSAASR